MLLSSQSAAALRGCSSCMLGRLRHASEAVAAVASSAAQPCAPSSSGAGQPRGFAQQHQQESGSSSGAAAAAAAAAAAGGEAPLHDPRVFNTKSFGEVRVPAGMPLPSFIRAEQKAKRPAVALADALQEVKASARANFDETVELALRLGVDPRRGDQAVRGTATLPHGTGKSVRVAAFATGADADAAREAGADVVGADELIEAIRAGGSSAIDFHKCVATPEMMPRLSKAARVLGPRGMMPNPKLGTVSASIGDAVRTVKAGRVEFRADKGAVLHAPVGKASFGGAALEANAGALVQAVLGLRPKGLKGSGASGYLLSASVSSTMGPGVPVTLASLVGAAQASKAQR